MQTFKPKSPEMDVPIHASLTDVFCVCTQGLGLIIESDVRRLPMPAQRQTHTHMPHSPPPDTLQPPPHRNSFTPPRPAVSTLPARRAPRSNPDPVRPSVRIDGQFSPFSLRLRRPTDRAPRDCIDFSFPAPDVLFANHSAPPCRHAHKKKLTLVSRALVSNRRRSPSATASRR